MNAHYSRIGCRFALLTVLAVSFLLADSNSALRAQSDRELAKLFPESTVGYLEIPRLDRLVDQILNHPMRERIEAIPDVKKALKDSKLKDLKVAVALFEAQVGESWQKTLSTISGGGMAFGLDKKTNGFIAVVRSTDEAKLKRTVGTLLEWARADAKQNGRPAPFKIESFRSGKVAKFDGGLLARIDQWLLVSNKAQLVNEVADRLLDGKGRSLADLRAYQEAKKGSDRNATVWGFADLNAVREAGMAKELFVGRTQDVGAEILVGGIMGALQDADYVAATAKLDDQRFSLNLAIPHDKRSLSESREFYFGKNGRGYAPRGLKPKNTLIDITSYRDIGELWLTKEDLFDENVVAQLAQADSQLSTVFGGLDFGEEVLGAMKPHFQIIATRQAYPDGQKMDIQIPAFAIVGRLRDAERSRRRFKVAYQSLIGFANIGLGQQDMPLLDMETERKGDSVITSAAYLPDEHDESNSILYNFSPTIAFHGETMVISSTKALAAELIELSKAPDAWEESDVHTSIVADAALIKKALVDNRESLVTQNMLEKGQSRRQSEAEIDLILSVLDFVKTANAQLDLESNRLELNLAVEFANPTE